MLSASMLGVAISLVANLLINVGLNIQKLAHERSQRTSALALHRPSLNEDPESSASAATPGGDDDDDEVSGAEASTFCSMRWLLGLGIQLFGESGNMVAYSFAAASIIAPLGAVGLLANIYIATCFLGEPFRFRDVIGSCLAGGGAALVAVWAPSDDLQMTSDQLLHRVILQLRFGYLVAVIVVGLGLYWVERSHARHPTTARFLGISAAFASFTIFSIKGVSLLLRSAIAQRSFAHLASPVFIGLIPVALVSGPGQIFWLNKVSEWPMPVTVAPACRCANGPLLYIQGCHGIHVAPICTSILSHLFFDKSN